MKVAQLTKYSKKDPQIEINSIPLPKLKPNDLKIKVTYAGVNPLDNLIAHGDVKLIVPYKVPINMGNEFVGKVTQIGSNVKKVKVGDRVFARMPLDKIGAFAEEVVIDANAVATVPEYLTDKEAATIPLTALTAMQALELMHAKPGQTLFISGGTGSFGAMAIPIAVAKGLKVITTGSTQKKENVLKLGVSQFIDYRTQDYTKLLSNVDLAIDTLGGKELEKQMSILKPGGIIVSLKAMPTADFAKRMHMSKAKQLLFKLASRKIVQMANKYQVHYHFIFVHADGKQLQEAADILARAEVHPIYGDIFTLDQTKAAMDKVAHGHNKGKVLLKIAN